MKTRILLVLLALASGAFAQKAPRIGYVYPAGGRQGATFDVMLGGQGLVGANDVAFTGRGIEAEVVGFERPLSGKETELMREKLRAMEDEQKAARASSERKMPDGAKAAEIAALIETLSCFGNGPPFNVAIAENVKLRVTLAPDAALGEQELRVITPGGLSNPLVFNVGQLPEFSEPGARGSKKAEIDTYKRRDRRRESSDAAKAPPQPAPVVPAVFNGQVLAGEVDRIRFTAKGRQRVLVAVSARRLIPYLPDAVPGWFQATISLHDSTGRELAYADDFRFHPDPVLCFDVPCEGEYEIAIRDSIYRGREDFVYRITVGELPFVTSIFPLGATAGTQCNVQLRGWNLTAPSLAVDLKSTSPGFFPLVATRGQTVSNFVPLAVDTLSDAAEKEPNDKPAAAQSLTAPIVVNGRIERQGDTDVFRIEGKAGAEIVAEIHARRLNSPLDSVLRITDATGRQIALNDDNEDKGAGLTTHHADSRLAVKLPADGAYFLHVADTQHAGSPDHAYRLRVGPPQPDFELRVVPSSLSGKAGGSVPVAVFAMRKDGFTGEIALALKGEAKGFKLSGGNIPEGKNETKLTLTLGEATDDPLALAIEGRAKAGGRELSHTAVPADDMQQAFAYHHFVPSKELRVAVAGRIAPSGQLKIETPMPLKLPLAGTAGVKVAAPVNENARSAQFELSDPPAGITIKRATITAQGADIEFAIEPGKFVAGEKGSLIVTAFTMRKNAKGKPRRIPFGVLPAIAFEIAADTLPSAEQAARP